MNSKGLLGEVVAEIFGTFILVLLGVGVVANVGLAPRMGSPAAFNWLTINIGWCFAVVVAVYTVGRVSGAHLNPAVTLAMALRRGFPWGKVIPVWVAQLIGAFLGAVGVYLVYSDGLVAAGLPNVFTTGPGSTFAQTYWGADAARQATGSYSILTATIAEIIGTAVLLWGILGAFDSKNLGVGANLGPLFVGFAVLAVCVYQGGASG
jgi:glycerol uptake facilitator protein